MKIVWAQIIFWHWGRNSAASRCVTLELNLIRSAEWEVRKAINNVTTLVCAASLAFLSL